MNTIGIDNNLDRPRIKKLLVIGLFASFLTGIGDFMLGYGAAENMGNYGLAASVMASAPNLADWQIIAGGLLGFFGIFLEGLAYFAIYRLMADAAPKYAHLYRAGFLCFGNAFMFGGLLATLPDQESFDCFQEKISNSKSV